MSTKYNGTEYKTPVKKLMLYFESSRNKWRARSVEKQKRINYLETKLRDLEKSRTQWKIHAKELQKTLKKNTTGWERKYIRAE